MMRAIKKATVTNWTWKLAVILETSTKVFSVIACLKLNLEEKLAQNCNADVSGPDEWSNYNMVPAANSSANLRPF